MDVKREDLGLLTNRKRLLFHCLNGPHSLLIEKRCGEKESNLKTQYHFSFINLFLNIVLYTCIKSYRLLLGQIVRYWRWLLMRVADVPCVIIHESGLQISCLFLYLMAASATRELLLEFSSSKEKDDPLVDSWGGKSLSLIIESHKEILNHDRRTSIFVECTLVMFMLETLCKICL